MARGRASIFIPKKATPSKMRDNLDVSASQAKMVESEDDDDDSFADIKTKSGKGRYNLLSYNRERKKRLNEFDFTEAPAEEEDDKGFDHLVMMANKLNVNCLGNLEISLFWEEKIFIFIRTTQLYSLLYIFYYEQWPSKTRINATRGGLGINGMAYIEDQAGYYAFMQDFQMVQYVVGATILFNVFLMMIGLVLTCKKTLRYRLEFKNTGCINIYRWYFWFMEIVFVPLIINVSWPGYCKFWTERDALQFIPSEEDGTIYYWAIKGCLAGSYILAALYNVQLFGYIYKNKISTAFHEQAV